MRDEAQLQVEIARQDSFGVRRIPVSRDVILLSVRCFVRQGFIVWASVVHDDLKHLAWLTQLAPA